MPEPIKPSEPQQGQNSPDPSGQQPSPAGDPQQQGQQEPDEPLGEGGLRALQSEREARKAAEKAAADAAARIKEFEDRDKSELQKAQDAAAEADQRAVDAWREALTAAHGISDEDAEVFLTGTDAETLKRQAARLVELHGGQALAGSPTTTHRPTERLRSGVDPTQGETPTLAEQITAAEAAGDWAKARSLKSQQLLELTKQTR
jgi:hypothetical protein